METFYVNGNGVASKTDLNGKRVFQLRVRSVEAGESFMVRTLHDSYCGLFTHWVNKRSRVCKGLDSGCMHCKAERIWKGYAATEMWNNDTKKWFPIVLEMTEHMELDFRGIFKRGQIWECFNMGRIDGRASPTQAKLHEELGNVPLPLPPDIVPVLQTLYHTTQLNLACKNPLPPRVIVCESDGPPPAMYADRPVEHRMTGEEMAEARRKHAEQFNAAKKTPLEKQFNGKH